MRRRLWWQRTRSRRRRQLRRRPEHHRDALCECGGGNLVSAAPESGKDGRSRTSGKVHMTLLLRPAAPVEASSPFKVDGEWFLSFSRKKYGSVVRLPWTNE